ncbi:hypothetical protein ACN28E_37535 [Archangium lansingense]|uniref:hypothetical protein n=1 Tax=Archangium lansingense TaxID=2995310 RepID=UPI003B822A2F
MSGAEDTLEHLAETYARTRMDTLLKQMRTIEVEKAELQKRLDDLYVRAGAVACPLVRKRIEELEQSAVRPSTKSMTKKRWPWTAWGHLPQVCRRTTLRCSRCRKMLISRCPRASSERARNSLRAKRRPSHRLGPCHDLAG